MWEGLYSRDRSLWAVLWPCSSLRAMSQVVGGAHGGTSACQTRTAAVTVIDCHACCWALVVEKGCAYVCARVWTNWYCCMCCLLPCCMHTQVKGFRGSYQSPISFFTLPLASAVAREASRVQLAAAGGQPEALQWDPQMVPFPHPQVCVWGGMCFDKWSLVTHH